MEKNKIMEKETIEKWTVIILIFIAGYFVKDFLGDSKLITFLNSNFLAIIAVIVSPVIAVYVGEIIQKKNYQKKKEDKIIMDLITHRNQVNSDEFLGALNSIVLVFHESSELKGLVKNLHRSMMNRANQEVVDQMIIELIYEICKYKNYSVTENEIRNSFIVKSNPE